MKILGDTYLWTLPPGIMYIFSCNQNISIGMFLHLPCLYTIPMVLCSENIVADRKASETFVTLSPVPPRLSVGGILHVPHMSTWS